MRAPAAGISPKNILNEKDVILHKKFRLMFPKREKRTARYNASYLPVYIYTVDQPVIFL